MAEWRKSGTHRLTPVTAGASFSSLPPPHEQGHSLKASVGNFFYEVGFTTEYTLRRVGRVLRDAGILLGQLFALLGGWLFRWLRAFVAGIGRDISEPFRRFGQHRRQLVRMERMRAKTASGGERERTFARGHASALLRLAANVGGYIMPVMAAVILVFTVSSVTSMQYALKVEYNGQVLGYVADQSVVEGAKTLLRDRLRLADNQEATDWQLTPTYAIAQTSSLTTTNQLANEILLSGGAGEGDIVSATGFYMDDGLVAVTADGERLQAYLEELLYEAERTAPPEAEVAFVGDIAFDPDSGDVFFADSVQPVEELIDMLKGNVSDDVYHVASGMSNLADIAMDNAMTLETLLARNPQLEGADGSYLPEEGERLLIQRATPFLQVQSTIKNSMVELIPYQTEEINNPERPRGVRVTVQEGVDGLQEVWYEEIWVDGVYDGRVRLDELTVVLETPVDAVVEVGSREPQDYLGDLSAPGFIFPVPQTTYSTRGYSPGGHRGLDINAPGGVPIYACESGTVIAAGWHYSFGYYVEISHAGGVNTLYAHCSALYVSAGEHVGKGTAIGAVGSTGNSSGNHCHLEVTVNGVLTNPVAYVGYPY